MNILHIALIFVYFILWQHNTTQVMKDEQLFLPVSVVREWQDHGTCGPQFKAWMDKFLTNHGKLIDPEEEKKKEEESNKRSGDGQTSGSSPKKPRIEAADLISKEHYLTATEIQQPLIQEVKLEKSMPTVHLRGGDTAFLVNMSDKEWTGCHPCIAMFGNGTYKILKEGQEGNEKSIELQFASSEDLVILGGSMQKLGQVLKDMREKKPDCRICYFQVVEDQQSTGGFTLKQTHRVIFQKKDGEEGQIGKHNLGMKLPFRSSPLLKVIWHVRWTTKGLSPVKPACHVLGQVNLAAGEALRLHSSG